MSIHRHSFRTQHAPDLIHVSEALLFELGAQQLIAITPEHLCLRHKNQHPDNKGIHDTFIKFGCKMSHHSIITHIRMSFLPEQIQKSHKCNTKKRVCPSVIFNEILYKTTQILKDI